MYFIYYQFGNKIKSVQTYIHHQFGRQIRDC